MLLRRIPSWILLVGCVNAIETASPHIRLEYDGEFLTIEGDYLNDTIIDDLLGSLNDEQTKRVTGIHLPEKGMTRVPSNIKRFCNVSSVKFSKNQITKIESGTFKGFNSLKIIHLDHNQIETIESGAFESLPNLTWINLRDNQLATIDKGGFKELPSLAIINLENNQLTTIESGIFKDLPRLETIHLENNQLTTIETRAFENLPRLSIILLDNNQLTTLKGDMFSGLQKLSVLNFANNLLNTVDSSVFDVLKTLNCLNLQNNRLSSLPDSIKNLNQKYINVNVRENPSFSFESRGSALGLRELRRIVRIKFVFDENQLKKLNIDIPDFIDEYSKRESLHWNFDELKELRLPEAKDSSLSVDEMLEIVDRLTPAYEESMIKRNTQYYIEIIYGKRVSDNLEIEEKNFPMARRLLGNIIDCIKKFADSGREDVAKACLAALSNEIGDYWYFEQGAALNGVYSLIYSKYRPQSDNIVDILKHEIAALKNSKFISLVKSERNNRRNRRILNYDYILNYWMVKMKDVLGITVNLAIEVGEPYDDDLFRGDSALVLECFLEDVFIPDEIIGILTRVINDDEPTRNAFLSFIHQDKTSEPMDTVSNLHSRLYEKAITKDAVEQVLIKMNLLRRTDKLGEKNRLKRKASDLDSSLENRSSKIRRT